MSFAFERESAHKELDESSPELLAEESAEDADEFSETGVLDDDEFIATAVLDDGDDFLDDGSAVFEVADILAELGADDTTALHPARRARRRIEALAERKRRHRDLMDFDDYELDF